MNNFTFNLKDSQSIASQKLKRTLMDIMYSFAKNKEAFEQYTDEENFVTYRFKNQSRTNERSNCIFNVPAEFVENPNCGKKENRKEKNRQEKYSALSKCVEDGFVSAKVLTSTVKEFHRRTSYIAIHDGTTIKWIEQNAKGTQRYNKKQCAKIKDACNFFSTIHGLPFFATFTFDRKLFNKNLKGTWTVGAEALTRFLHNVSRNVKLDYVRVAEAHATGHCHYHAILFTDENKEKYLERKKKNGDKYVLKGRLRDEFERNWSVDIKKLLNIKEWQSFLDTDYLKGLLESGQTKVKLGYFDLRIIHEKEYVQNYITKYISKEKTQKIEEITSYEQFKSDKKIRKTFYTFFMPCITKTRTVAFSHPRKVSKYIKEREEVYFENKEYEGMSEEQKQEAKVKKKKQAERLAERGDGFLPRYMEYKGRGESLAYLKELCINSTIPCLRGVYNSLFKPHTEKGVNRLEVLNADFGHNEDNIISSCKPLNCGSCVITQFIRFVLGVEITWFNKGDKEKNLRKKLEETKATARLAEEALKDERIVDSEKITQAALETFVKNEEVLYALKEKLDTFPIPKGIKQIDCDTFITNDGKNCFREWINHYEKIMDSEGVYVGKMKHTMFYRYHIIDKVKDISDEEAFRRISIRGNIEDTLAYRRFSVVEECQYDERILPLMYDNEEIENFKKQNETKKALLKDEICAKVVTLDEEELREINYFLQKFRQERGKKGKRRFEK